MRIKRKVKLILTKEHRPNISEDIAYFQDQFGVEYKRKTFYGQGGESYLWTAVTDDFFYHSKSQGHGSSTGHSILQEGQDEEPLHIDYIYGKNRFQIAYYNLYLWWQWTKREIDRRREHGRPKNLYVASTISRRTRY